MSLIFGRNVWQYIAILIWLIIIFFVWTQTITIPGSNIKFIPGKIETKVIGFLLGAFILFFWNAIFKQNLERFSNITWWDLADRETIYREASNEAKMNGADPELFENNHWVIDYMQKPPAFIMSIKKLGGGVPEMIAIGNALKRAPFRLILHPEKYEYFVRRWGFNPSTDAASISIPSIVEAVWPTRYAKTLDEVLDDLKSHGVGGVADSIRESRTTES